MDRIRKVFERALAVHLPGQDIVLERPKSGELGDLAFPCFRAAKAFGKNPAQVATELASQINLEMEGAELIAAGPYLNLKLRPEARAKEIEDILHRHPAISEAAVVSMPHARLGETVCAYVIVKAGRSLGLDLIITTRRRLYRLRRDFLAPEPGKEARLVSPCLVHRIVLRRLDSSCREKQCRIANQERRRQPPGAEPPCEQRAFGVGIDAAGDAQADQEEERPEKRKRANKYPRGRRRRRRERGRRWGARCALRCAPRRETG